jgi:hypothetical protein
MLPMAIELQSKRPLSTGFRAGCALSGAGFGPVDAFKPPVDAVSLRSTEGCNEGDSEQKGERERKTAHGPSLL